jgi:hypothetical protein
MTFLRIGSFVKQPNEEDQEQEQEQEQEHEQELTPG